MRKKGFWTNAYLVPHFVGVVRAFSTAGLLFANLIQEVAPLTVHCVQAVAPLLAQSIDAVPCRWPKQKENNGSS